MSPAWILDLGNGFCIGINWKIKPMYYAVTYTDESAIRFFSAEDAQIVLDYLVRKQIVTAHRINILEHSWG